MLTGQPLNPYNAPSLRRLLEGIQATTEFTRQQQAAAVSACPRLWTIDVSGLIIPNVVRSLCRAFSSPEGQAYPEERPSTPTMCHHQEWRLQEGPQATTGHHQAIMGLHQAIMGRHQATLACHHPSLTCLLCQGCRAQACFWDLRLLQTSMSCCA